MEQTGDKKSQKQAHVFFNWHKLQLILTHFAVVVLSRGEILKYFSLKLWRGMKTLRTTASWEEDRARNCVFYDLTDNHLWK